jgi:hypothetical protein
MRRWPPVLWILVYVGSVLILMGSRGRWGLLIIGGLMVAIACARAVQLALRPGSDAPQVPGAGLAIGFVAAFYFVAAVAAAVILGIAYGIATLLAGLIPATAVAIVLATIRRKTAVEGDRLRDASAGDHSDPLPGIGADGPVSRGARRG